MTVEGATGAMTSPTGPEATEGPPAPTREFSKNWIASSALPIVFIGIIATFCILRPNTFATTSNVRTLLLTQSVPAIAAIAVLTVLIVGQFDLSVGANIGVAVIIVTGFPSKYGMGAIPAIICALAATTLVGLFNGYLIARLGLNALIVTLATTSLLTGAVNWYSEGKTFNTGIPKVLNDLGSSWRGIPIPFIILSILAVCTWFFMERTPMGRYMHAVGGSADAARLAGVRVSRLTMGAFVVSGLLAGSAGVIQAGILGTGNPTVGPGFLLPAYSAAFLGATAIKAGVFNVPGTIIAVFTVATGISGLELVGVPYYFEPIFTGGALVIAVIASRFLQRYKR